MTGYNSNLVTKGGSEMNKYIKKFGLYGLVILLVASIGLLAVSCTTGASLTTTNTTTNASLTSISVTPSNPSSIAVGSTQQFTATATYSDGSTADISSQVSWSSDSPNASVSTGGLATAVAAGTANITAAMSGVTSSAVVMTITVPQEVPTTITVSPATSASIAVGSTQQFIATASYPDNPDGDISGAVTWTSDTPSVATIAPLGLATGVAVGTANITATLAGVTSAPVTLTVTSAAALVSIAVTPELAPNVLVGGTQQYTATGTYSDNSTADITSQVAWTTDTPSVLTISSSGLATGVDVGGPVVINATLSGITSPDVSLTVSPPPMLGTITLSPSSPASLKVGSTQQFTATGNYLDGSTADITSQVTWASDAVGVATVSSSGLVTVLGPGSANISASLSGVNSAMVSVTIIPGPALSSITVTPTSPVSLAAITSQQFTATGMYADGITADITNNATWMSSNVNVVIFTDPGVLTVAGTGNATITASLAGVTSPAVAVTVPTLTSIVLTPALSVNIAVGPSLQFVASGLYSDLTTIDISSMVTWTSSDTTIATVSPSGLVAAVASGTCVITASMNGVTSPGTTVTVN
jgi:trimeric autotransporter adhesin